MINVFYDDRCPLCSREIEYYKKVSPPELINWYGVSQHICTLEKWGITYIESLKLLHAINADGKIYRGIDAFILIWQQIYGWRRFAIVMKLPLIYHASKALYRIFAHWRFDQLNHCKIGHQNDPIK